MKAPFIIDAHVHTGFMNGFFAEETDAASLVRRMDSLGIAVSVNLCDMISITRGPASGVPALIEDFEHSDGRIYYCGTFDPGRGTEDLRYLEKILGQPGFRGIKIHPPWHKVSADSHSYEPVWKFAADNDLVLVSHTWSYSSYNPAQALSLPGLFEGWIKKYPKTRFLMTHAGGRGDGHAQAVRLASDYENVYLDCAGDIYIPDLFVKLEKLADGGKIMFGSDWPMMDPRAHMSHIMLAGIPAGSKLKVLRTNAVNLYRLPV
ncbi:MAG: hypothetical protein E4H36_10135 [Spirochaetales bacterium]|nr:MAG: hypothetical protein E4H36_10135 [Spirochaetales bacterium]